MSATGPIDQNPTAPHPGASEDPDSRVIPRFAPVPEGRAKKRYVIVGTGHRSGMYVDALIHAQAEVGEIVAWVDPNNTRIGYYDDLVREELGLAAGLPRYAPEDLERAITENRADAVVITSPDLWHAGLASRALATGANVIVEKPLTTTAEGCRSIADAVGEYGGDVLMTFNYRYAPRNSTLREVIRSGAIGDVTSVHFEWALDTVHGADYFRRWHRERKNSGTLLIHKAAHHFDLVNWWIADSPVRVFASAGLRFYGDENARRRGMGERPERGTGAEGDPFSLDLHSDPRLEALYLNAEHEDGYRRDQDPFAPGVTIYDNMSVLVDYSRGATMSYSLNAHSPWEGYRVTVNGTEGRAELEVVERGAVLLDTEGNAVLDPSATPVEQQADQVRPERDRLVVQRHWQPAHEVEIPAGIGGHGGGDQIMLMDVFRADLRLEEDPLGRAADWVDGVRAVAVGIAANESIATGNAVTIADLNLGVELG